MKKRKGQIDISFGFIFGIIIIIATVAVAFYAISYFVKLQKCATLGNFYNDLGTEINETWVSSGKTQKPISFSVPSEVKSVCFGDLTTNPLTDSRTQYESLREKYLGQNKNVFIYPSKNSCGSRMASYKFDHLDIERFFCVSQINGKINLKIAKNSTSPLVILSK